MTAGGAIEIREARPDERAQLTRLALEAYGEYEALLGKAGWNAYRSNIVSTMEDPKDATCLVARQDGAIVGSVLLYPPQALAYGGPGAGATYPEVRLLAVAPAARGHGIGDALMADCERRAAATGARAIGLHTTDFMRSAMRLYARRGYVAAPETDFSPAPGLVICGFRLALPEA